MLIIVPDLTSPRRYGIARVTLQSIPELFLESVEAVGEEIAAILEQFLQNSKFRVR
jgi:hypothetical protein